LREENPTAAAAAIVIGVLVINSLVLGRNGDRAQPRLGRFRSGDYAFPVVVEPGYRFFSEQVRGDEDRSLLRYEIGRRDQAAGRGLRRLWLPNFNSRIEKTALFE
jgi:hypothetical protein